jgi:hypothetical protein
MRSEPPAAHFPRELEDARLDRLMNDMRKLVIEAERDGPLPEMVLVTDYGDDEIGFLSVNASTKSIPQHSVSVAVLLSKAADAYFFNMNRIAQKRARKRIEG